jgi:hypothetical protein
MGPKKKSRMLRSQPIPSLQILGERCGKILKVTTESMHPWRVFKDCQLARMSDGHYCLLKSLGPVKGGNGMKHHEVVIDFSRRGTVKLFQRLIRRKKPPVER